MAKRLVRTVILLSLIFYFISKIIAAYNKLQEGKIGTTFNTINSNTVEVVSVSIVCIIWRLSLYFSTLAWQYV